jgi:hypothetical protein
VVAAVHFFCRTIAGDDRACLDGQAGKKLRASILRIAVAASTTSLAAKYCASVATRSPDRSRAVSQSASYLSAIGIKCLRYLPRRDRPSQSSNSNRRCRAWRIRRGGKCFPSLVSTGSSALPSTSHSVSRTVFQHIVERAFVRVHELVRRYGPQLLGRGARGKPRRGMVVVGIDMVILPIWWV